MDVKSAGYWIVRLTSLLGCVEGIWILLFLGGTVAIETAGARWDPGGS